MRIGIIGAGHIGGTLARLLTNGGYEVAIANSRGPETLQEFEKELGPNAFAATVEEAAKFGDVVIVSIPFREYRHLPAQLLAGKIVIDTNNYYPERDGHYNELDMDRTTVSELLQAHLQGARVVKAFNSLYAEWLANHGRQRGDAARVAIPISGNDSEAKRVVARIIDAIGFDPVDAGDLAAGGRRHQQGAPVYGVELPAEQMRQRFIAEEELPSPPP
jgi:predicted dinucleotide-binding enzyme